MLSKVKEEILEGVINAITYQDERTGYTVLRFFPDDIQRVVTVVGRLPSVNIGERLHLIGGWTNHQRFGRQFQVKEYKLVLPSSKEGVMRYLGSGLIPGIGPKFAEKIVNALGEKALEKIQDDPVILKTIDGIGPKKAASIIKGLKQKDQARESMIFLQGLGISSNMALRLFKHFGEKTIEIIRENPYRLADEVSGIGFKRADEIAKSMGIKEDSFQRAKAGVLYLLREAVSDGHVYLPQKTLENQAKSLNITEEKCKVALGELAKAKRVVVEATSDTPIYLTALYRNETAIAQILYNLASRELPVYRIDEKWLKSIKISLSQQQQQAVISALKYGGIVITGGPGTGKTTVLKTICQAVGSFGLKVELAAPTGRAAQRLSEATGLPARTIHRLLEVQNQPGETPFFNRNMERPISADMVIIDETSMVDINLFYYLLQAIDHHTRLVLVGDENQLPSVGPGTILKDIISSGVLPVVRLSKVFRQASASAIVSNAHRILHGEIPKSEYGSDFYFLPMPKDKVADKLVELVKDRLPQFLNVNPITDIQLLTPVKKGPLGVENLNVILQEIFNPYSGSEVVVGGTSFRLNDKVMQIKNDYQKMVFNGDIGFIREVNAKERYIKVEYTDQDGLRLVTYEETDLSQLVHAYAISIHKSQGSEYECIVVPITWVMPALMNRNLLYTALTRARRFAVFIGESRALAVFVRNNQVTERFSLLHKRLLDYKST
jgi:exodeoxyribonuclease V alpha subunit